MASTELGTISSRYLRSLYESYPEMASYLGLHEYDGRISDPSESARRARITELEGFRESLARLDPAHLASNDLLDYELLRSNVESELYRLRDLRSFEWNPLIYQVDVSEYTKRSYAPLPERVRRMVSYLGQVPDYLAESFRNLRDQLPRHPVETAIEAFEGQIRYLRGDVREVVGQVEDAALLREFERACDGAASAIEDFVTRLRERLPNSNDDFAIGSENYRKMLLFGEMVDMPLERVLEVGQRNLRENEELLAEATGRANPGGDLEETLRQLGRDHPTAEGLIPETAEMLEDIRSFLIEHDIVSVPSEVRCQVQETPPFMRWGFAFMDSPGPFERVATEAFYYVTPVEEGWSPEEKEAWLSRFSYSTLRDVSVHEAYPGHYLHFLHLKSAPTDASKVLTSYAFVEGWAHYCEQMMVEAGYGDARLEVAQLTEALLRNCRYVVSILMHTQGMSVEEATRFFVEHGHMEELPARKEAVRGTFDPGYLNYTLGKLLILKLREDYRRERGEAFTLREFHDKLLSFGAPPVPLARRLMLTGTADGVL